MFDVPYTIETGGGTRVTVRSAGTRALILEVLLPPTEAAPWFATVGRYCTRIEVLHGSLRLNGELVRAGERLSIPGSDEMQLVAGVEEAHFLCEFQRAGDAAAAGSLDV